MQLVDKSSQVRIPRVDLAMDAGTVISPERARSQFEGAAVSGTSIAMLGEITAKNGQIEESNFHDYPVARIQEAPRQIHVHIVQSQKPPAGVANQACQRLRRRFATPSSLVPANGFATYLYRNTKLA